MSVELTLVLILDPDRVASWAHVDTSLECERVASEKISFLKFIVCTDESGSDGKSFLAVQ